jgi:hypothetical protein
MVTSPLGKGVLGTLGISEIDAWCKQLLRPVVQAGRQEFACAENPKGIAGLGSDAVLTTLSSRERKIHGSHTVTQGEFRQERRVFIIRVCTDHQCTCTN